MVSPTGAGRTAAGSSAAVPVTPAAHPVLAVILRLLPLLDITVVGIGALAFAFVFWFDRGRPVAPVPALPRTERAVLAAVNALLGIALLASSVILENGLAIRLTARGEGLAPLSLCILLAYLGFSSFGLAFSAVYSRPAPLLARVHPILSVAATAMLAVLVPFAAAAVRRDFLIGLVLVSAFSAAISFLQYRRMRPEGKHGGVEPDRAGASTVHPERPATGVPDLPAGFPPDLLTRFSEPQVIGRGGVSRVFRVRRKDSGRIVAVKVPLAMDEATGLAFLREMRTWEGLEHGNIARILGANILPTPYVEMEYFPRSLADVEKPLEVRSAALIVAGIARGLAFAHARGIIHRDLKPGNILLTGSMEPKIGDWGLSKFLGGATATDLSGFSPRYAAPEQIDPGRFGRPDRRTDIYGAGGIFYELVTGRPPFEGDGIAEITARILKETPVLPSLLNPEAGPVDPIIMRCLEKEPAGRYPSAVDLEKDLMAFLGEGNQGP